MVSTPYSFLWRCRVRIWARGSAVLASSLHGCPVSWGKSAGCLRPLPLAFFGIHCNVRYDISYLIEEASIINQKSIGTMKDCYDSLLHGWTNFELEFKWWNIFNKIEVNLPLPQTPQLEELKMSESKAPLTRYLGTRGGGEWLAKRSGRFFSQRKILRYELDGPQGLFKEVLSGFPACSRSFQWPNHGDPQHTYD